LRITLKQYLLSKLLTLNFKRSLRFGSAKVSGLFQSHNLF
ncbi:MAG: hypothetical protein ACI81S_001415, partial [Sphingobacteriales bacterium]